MKCPMSFAVDYEEENNPKFHVTGCLQSECAWWDEGLERCCMRTISACLYASNVALERMAGGVRGGTR